MKKKILILLTDAGNGHRSAADSLNKVFHRNYTDKFEIKTLDLFKIANVKPYNAIDETHRKVSSNRLIESFYDFMVLVTITKHGFSIFKKKVMMDLYSKCEKIILEEKPDLIISVHPIVSMVTGEIKKNNPGFKYCVVITDLLTLHRGWGDKNADLVFSGTKEAVNVLTDFGVMKERIIAPLFPLNPDMSNFRDRDVILNELAFEDQRQILLITGGGVGIGLLSKAIERIVQEDIVNLIIITARLEYFREELEKIYANNKHVKIFGFVKNMQDYIHVSDIIVGKPGPATVLEVELFDKKAILTKRIGKQEDGNIVYALNNKNFVYIGEKWNLMIDYVHKFLKMKKSSEKNVHQRRFDECAQIIEYSLKLIGE